MRPIAIAILLGWVLGMPASGQTAEPHEGGPLTPNVGIQSPKQAPDTDMPVYKPPKRSIPKGRVGGGIRGGNAPAIYVLAPDHVGLTKDEHPSLYWYLSKPTSLPLEFTLIDTRAIKPMLETRLKPPTQPGVQRISLKDKDFGVKLEPGVQYKWYVTMALGPESSSRDIVAGGTIERIPFVEWLLCAGNGDTVKRFADCGLWYDAIAVISDLIEAAPDDRKLKKQRCYLLEQVGLWEPARYECPE